MREGTSTGSGGRREFPGASAAMARAMASEVPGEFIAAAIGAGGALRKPVAKLLEANTEPGIKVRSTSNKGNYGLDVNSIPVEDGKLELEVERLEFTDTKTGERTHQAWITIGHSSNPTVIDLPSDRVQSAYSTIVHRLKEGEYDPKVVDGIVQIVPRGLDF